MSQVLHQEERRQFERLLKQQRMGRIADRLAILETFLASEEHLDAAGWHELLRQQGMELEPRFVAETLEMLTRFGLAERRPFEGGPPRYEHRHLGEHHDHLICLACGGISEFHNPELEALKEQVANEAGFHHLRHRLQIYGLCDKCRAGRHPTMPLSLASPGERVRVVEMQGGQGLCHQLADLGLHLGSELEVISNDGGPMVVAVKGSRMALGRGVARKVQVSHCGAPGEEPSQ